LQKEIKRICNSPLDAGKGEGYHRRTHLTIERAPSSSEKWTLASTREHSNLDLCRDFIREHGDIGKQVFSFEWFSVKRLLRPTTSKEYTPVMMNDTLFYKKLYCLEEIDPNWVSVVSDCGASAASGGDNGHSNCGVKNEWLRKVLLKNEFYSYPRTTVTIGHLPFPPPPTPGVQTWWEYFSPQAHTLL
jgi:hypothetical protein